MKVLTKQTGKIVRFCFVSFVIINILFNNFVVTTFQGSQSK